MKLTRLLNTIAVKFGMLPPDEARTLFDDSEKDMSERIAKLKDKLRFNEQIALAIKGGADPKKIDKPVKLTIGDKLLQYHENWIGRYVILAFYFWLVPFLRNILSGSGSGLGNEGGNDMAQFMEAYQAFKKMNNQKF